MTRSKLVLPLGALVLAGLVAVGLIYAIGPFGSNVEGEKAQGGPLAPYAQGEMAKFVSFARPEPLAAVSFLDAEGQEMGLDAFRGKVVLLNLWATWCPPCVHEMPALDALQGALGGEDFEVVALSVDAGDREKPRAFYAEVGLENLALYQDPRARAHVTLGAFGLPTTLLLDREGRMAGRLVGPAEWDSEDARALIRAAMEAGG